MASINRYSAAAGNDAAASELDEILADLHQLRSAVVSAWQARAIVLQKDEQQTLRAEIKKTCDLLTSLVESN